MGGGPPSQHFVPALGSGAPGNPMFTDGPRQTFAASGSQQIPVLQAV